MRHIGYLHIFGQFTYHDEAEIVGTRLGLEALSKAILKALKYREASSDPVFVNDGEGYTVEVKCVDDAGGLPVPYQFLQANADLEYWRTRAFEAEAKCCRMKNGLPEPVKPARGELKDAAK